MFSAETWTRPPRDTLDRIQRAAPHADRDTPQIEGRLKFDTQARHVKRLEHDLGCQFPVFGRVERRLRQQDVVLLRFTSEILK